ncbi:MAG: AsmA family protein, partial [Ignavibacteria bacterium]|nr:AsmA family protein [Ignavibacteria bacterium]
MAGSRKKTTLILLAIAVPLVVLAGTVVALRLYFNEGRLKELILPRLEAAARRPVTLDRVSLSVIPRITVNLEGLTISNRPGQGFTMKPMVSLEELVFALDFFPLLKGDVRISTMSFRRPHILLEVNSNGFSNYSEPDHAGGTPGGEQNGTGGGILIADAQITHGRLEYLNHKENTATVLEGVNYTIEVEAPRDAPRIKIEGTATVDDFSYGSVSSTLLSGLHLTLEHSLLYTRGSDSLIIERGTGSVNGMPLLASGFFADVSSETPHVDLIVTGDNLSITDLFSLIPREYMSRASGLQGEGNVQVRVQTTGTLTDSTRLSVVGQIASTNARAQFTGFPQAISNI